MSKTGGWIDARLPRGCLPVAEFIIFIFWCLKKSSCRVVCFWSLQIVQFMCLNLPFDPTLMLLGLGSKGKSNVLKITLVCLVLHWGSILATLCWFLDYWPLPMQRHRCGLDGSVKGKKSLFLHRLLHFFTLPQGQEQVYYVFLPVCGGCYLTLIASCVFVLGPAVPELTILSCEGWLNPSAPSEVCPVLHPIPSCYSTGFWLIFFLALHLKAHQSGHESLVRVLFLEPLLSRKPVWPLIFTGRIQQMPQ